MRRRYGTTAVEGNDEILNTTPEKPKRRDRENGKTKRIHVLDSDDEDGKIITPQINSSSNLATSSGWLEKTSHHHYNSKTKPPPRRSSSSSSTASSRPSTKKSKKIVHDSDSESDLEIFTIGKHPNDPSDNDDDDDLPASSSTFGSTSSSSFVNDISPTVIYQLQTDNITQLLRDRENQPKRGNRFQKRGQQGCSLSHTAAPSAATTARQQNSKKSSGRLLKKRIRSLSLTDSDVESLESFGGQPQERVVDSDDEGFVANPIKAREDVIVLESEDEETSLSKNHKSSKPKPIVVEGLESEEEGEGVGDDEDEGSFQSEGSDDEQQGSDNDSEDTEEGEKWYGGGSDSDGSGAEEKGEYRKRKRNGSDDEKTEEELQKEIERKCRRVLQRCGDVSKLLRQALLSWSTPSAPGAGAGAGADGSIGSCVNLISIHDQNSNIITQELITERISAKLALKDYQLVGLNWLKLMHTNDVNGVLADDMGLGKTVQTIAFVAWMHYDRQSRRKSTHTHLIVVPASTLSNWIQEFARFCPHLKVVRFHGTVNEKYSVKQLLRRALGSTGSHRSSKDRVDVVLTTYTQFERESGADDRKFLRKIPFEYLILDEAHCIKNSQSSRYANLRHLNTKRRLLLSGTPVQNDVRELLSLLGFLMPQVFRAEYIELLLSSLKLEHLHENDATTKPSTSRQKKLKDATPASSSTSSSSSDKMESIASLENLRTMLGPFVLRRLKRDVLNQLVEKEDHVIKIQMTASQKALYGDIIQRHMLRRAGIAQSNKSSSSSSVVLDLTGESNSGGVTDAEKLVRNISSSEANNIFTALRKAANHPLLLRVHFSDEKTLDLITSICQSTGHFGDQCDLKRIKSEIKEMSDFDINGICLEYPALLGHLQLSSAVLYESPKMKKLQTLLPQLIADGHRILIFSQWTKMLDIIGAFMEDLGLHFLRLDGSTPVRERQHLIDRFEKDKAIPIFILSTKAGGLGINLTAADTVILHDLDFNPENDRQAEDRCHRIGQTKNVSIYKLVAEDTVDEIIFETGQRKQRLTKAVLSDHGPSAGDGEGEEEEGGGAGKRRKGAKGSAAAGDGAGAGGGSEINKMLQAALQNYIRAKD